MVPSLWEIFRIPEGRINYNLMQPGTACGNIGESVVVEADVEVI